MRRILIAILLLLFTMAWLGLAAGDPAPDFSAINQDGKTVQLSQLKGKPVLLYFYPKDDTPGCTQEACAFRDHFKEFQAIGAVILGVSKQDSKSHMAFRAKYHLPFDLLSDPDGKMAASFGVKQMPVIGYLKRQSVLISASGKVVRFYSDVDPATHSKDVLKDLESHAIRAGKSG